MAGLSKQLKELLDRAETWPPGAQAELVRVGRDIEAGRVAVYHPTEEELAAIDDAEAGGVATEAEAAALLAKFRQA
ncbi:MAG TPA: hypothetical protein VFB16_03170 [Bauldia sp.]|nr:hypothetical protein [Bauldia sp.]